MNIKQKFGCLFAVLGLFVTTPIWYYLLYSILKMINATDVMWLLFWIYTPVGFVVSFVQVIVKSIFEEE